jgi:hypothetical protein
MSKLRFSLIIGLVAVLFLTAIPEDLFAQLEASDSGKQPVLDPFKVLIKPPKKPKPAPRVSRPTVRRNPGPPPVPPLVIKVTAIAGEEPNFVAVIKYKGGDYIVEPGQESEDGVFKVRQIYPDRIEVFYSKDKSVKSFTFQ